MKIDKEWLMDLACYSTPRVFLKDQSIWAVYLYRQGRRINTVRNIFLKKFLNGIYWPLFRIVETVTGISLPKDAVIGGGLRIWHFGGIFIHPDVKIGTYCTLRQGVTIGNRHENGPVPRIGNHVEFGAYAQVLGGVTIGDNCKIGAMSVVLHDVPSGATVAGIPARIVATSE